MRVADPTVVWVDAEITARPSIVVIKGETRVTRTRIVNLSLNLVGSDGLFPGYRFRKFRPDLDEGPLVSQVVQLGRFAIREMNGRPTCLREYEKPYPGNRVNLIFRKVVVTDVEIRSLTAGEVDLWSRKLDGLRAGIRPEEMVTEPPMRLPVPADLLKQHR
jgi:hypothetical protein